MTALLLAAMICLDQIAPAPPPFALTTPAGSTVHGAAVLAGERRVIIYVSPDIEPAARLIAALRRWQEDDPGRWQERVSVIVAAPVPEARAWLTAHWGDGALPGWFADPDASGWHALGFQGSLGVAGLSRGIVEWKLDGVINNPVVLEPSIRAWVGAAP